MQPCTIASSTRVVHPSPVCVWGGRIIREATQTLDVCEPYQSSNTSACIHDRGLLREMLAILVSASDLQYPLLSTPMMARQKMLVAMSSE